MRLCNKYSVYVKKVSVFNYICNTSYRMSCQKFYTKSPNSPIRTASI